MSGYYGFSMSNNAIECYRDNIKPLSAWSKSDILSAIDQAAKDGEAELSAPIAEIKKLSVKELKSLCLKWDSWHHTSSHFNKTDFYKLDVDGVERLTVEMIQEVISARKPKQEATGKKAFCEYLEWSGTRKHPKATVCQAWGTIKGNWFYLENGKKKSISANGFKVLEEK